MSHFMEDFWEKKLADGTVEIGTNSRIEKKLASWTQGRQDIVEATLSFGQGFHKVTLSCPKKDGKLASWEQLDYSVFRPATGASQVLGRSISCTTNGYKFVGVGTDPQTGTKHFDLSDEYGYIAIPHKAEAIVCKVGPTGARIGFKYPE